MKAWQPTPCRRRCCAEGVLLQVDTSSADQPIFLRLNSTLLKLNYDEPLSFIYSISTYGTAQRAIAGSDAHAVETLPFILQCFFCGATPARQLCVRCRKARYCGAACIQRHWNNEIDPHRGDCRRAVEAAMVLEVEAMMVSEAGAYTRPRIGST